MPDVVAEGAEGILGLHLDDHYLRELAQQRGLHAPGAVAVGQTEAGCRAAGCVPWWGRGLWNIPTMGQKEVCEHTVPRVKQAKTIHLLEVNWTLSQMVGFRSRRLPLVAPPWRAVY